MTDRLIAEAMERRILLEVSEDKKSVAVFHESKQADTRSLGLLAVFHIEEVWDMIRDALATIDARPIAESSLFRRKGEAVAGILHTNKLYSKKD